ncbi:MAG: hypothetical protein ACE5OZ_22705 [Candidatus Heimdallarchaeota archaeon]
MNHGDKRAGVQIRRKEFDELMNRFNGQIIKPKGTAEIVYRIPVQKAKELSIWVYSTIPHSTGISRKLGADAIRIMIFYEDRKIVMRETKTLRKGKWKDNVERKIRSLMKRTTDKRCPQSHPLVQRTRKKDGKPFYGCALFPECKYIYKRE